MARPKLTKATKKAGIPPRLLRDRPPVVGTGTKGKKRPPVKLRTKTKGGGRSGGGGGGGGS